MQVKSISDIAKLAGVGTTTVSAILNGKARQYRISEKTEKKVRDIVKQYNYQPNVAARSLRTKKTNTIGLVIPDLTNRYFANLAKAVERYARENNYQVLIASSEEGVETEKQIFANMAARSVDAILATPIQDKDLLEYSKELNVPIVYVNRQVEQEKISWVASDNYNSVAEMINVLIDDDIREIAYIGGSNSITSNDLRLKAYEDTLLKNNIVPNHSIIVSQHDTSEAGYQAIRNIYERDGKLPESLFTSCYVIMRGVLSFLKEQFGTIDCGIKLCTFDDVDELDYISSPIHSIQQDCDTIGKTAFDIVLSLINNGTEISQQELIPTKLKIRK